jgi:hypothetical protein
MARLVIETRGLMLAERLYGCYRDTIAQTHQLDARELRRQLLPWENLRAHERDFWEMIARKFVHKSMFGDL